MNHDPEDVDDYLESPEGVRIDLEEIHHSTSFLVIKVAEVRHTDDEWEETVTNLQSDRAQAVELAQATFA